MPTGRPKHQPPLSTTERIIWNEYADSGLDQPWDSARVDKLAGSLGLSIRELGAACCIDANTMVDWYVRGAFPPYVCLHFATLVTLWRECVLKHKPGISPVDKVWARILAGIEK